ncbi:MAG TPA: helix-turn-helix transcriptional regulator [Rhizomicrobium sp.]
MPGQRKFFDIQRSARDWKEALEAIENAASAKIKMLLPALIVGELVRTARVRRNLKQSALSSLTGVSLSTIQRIERGQGIGSPSLQRVELALELQPGHFTDPQVPPSFVAMKRELDSRATDMTDVHFKRIEKQTQVATLLDCDMQFVWREKLDAESESDLERLKRWLEMATQIISTERSNRQSFLSKVLLKKRRFYSFFLDEVRKVERSRKITVLAGIYEPKIAGAPKLTTSAGIILARRKWPNLSGAPVKLPFPRSLRKDTPPQAHSSVPQR